MHHSFVDKYSQINSPIHQIEAKAKLIAFASLCVVIVLLANTSLVVFSLIFLFLTVLLAISKVPLGFVIKKVATLLPFALFISFFMFFFSGLDFNVALTCFLGVLIKASLSAFALVLLVSTTKFEKLVFCARKLGLPGVLADSILFMYRYLYLITDEAMKMQRARKLRGGKGVGLSNFFAAAGIVGTLFLRSYNRAERVYHAMLARGYKPSHKRVKYESI